MTAPGWYHAEGDAAGTHRYWDGTAWVGDPVAQATSPSPQSPPVPPPGVPYPANRTNLADPMSRIGARLIDILILFAVLFAIISFDLGTPDAALVEASDTTLTFNGHSLDSRVEYLLSGLFGVVWSIAWIHLKGATPGKLVLGLRIADAETMSGPPDLQQAVMRSANYFLSLVGVIAVSIGGLISFVGIVIGIVSLILLFSDDQHRTVMDRFAKTVVTKGYPAVQ